MNVVLGLAIGSVLALVILGLKQPELLKALFGSKVWKKLFMESARLAIAVIVVVMTLNLVEILFKVSIPEGNRDAVMIVIGIITSKFSTIVDFFYGSSKGSSDKTDAMAAKKEE